MLVLDRFGRWFSFLGTCSHLFRSGTELSFLRTTFVLNVVVVFPPVLFRSWIYDWNDWFVATPLVRLFYLGLSTRNVCVGGSCVHLIVTSHAWDVGTRVGAPSWSVDRFLWVGWLHPNAKLLLLLLRVKRALDLFLRLSLWLFSRVSGTHAWLRFDGG